MTTEQIAEYLQLKPVTVRRKATRGEIPAIRIGKQFRFDKGKVDRWLFERRTGKPAHVLVVDDEPPVVEVIRDILEANGYQVTATLYSSEALELIKRRHFDLVFLDLVMPDVDGAELFKYIREADKDLPVVIVTAYPDSQLMEKAMEHGPFLIIRKPFVIEDILEVMRGFNRSAGK